MLKKTGIVVAAVATGLIGLSPLAFADDWGHGGPDTVEVNKDFDVSDSSIDREQYNECAFIQNEESSTVVSPGLLDGVLPPLSSVLGDQSQTGNCTNVGDTTGAALPAPTTTPPPVVTP